MGFLYFLEKLRMPGLNEFMLTVTQLGEETAFLILAMIFFWCVDKKRGYLLLCVGFLGTVANQFMKLWFRIPRPWVLDPEFTILEGAREAAAGYSFPSGHTTSATATFGSIAATAGKRKNAWICVILVVMVGLSRMYIGVHTPLDVIAGALTSITLIAVLYRPVMDGKHLPAVFCVMTALAVGLLLFVRFFPFPEDVDAHNLESGLKSACTMVGSVVGVGAVCLLEKKYVNFSTKAVWWVQILKVVLGFGLILAVKEGLRAPLDNLFGNPYPARMVRYFLMVLVGGLLWPMSFRFFEKIGCKKENIG